MNVRLLAAFVLLVVMAHAARGQDEQFKALFMYNFTKYLEWPAEKEQGDFVITVFGNSPIINELKIIAQKKQVGSQKITVKKVSTVAESATCNILFIPSNKSVPVAELKNKLNNKGVVIITDKPGLAKSVSGINYVKKDGKQSFEINKKHIEEQGVKVNSSLLTLGIRVE